MSDVEDTYVVVPCARDGAVYTWDDSSICLAPSSGGVDDGFEHFNIPNESYSYQSSLSESECSSSGTPFYDSGSETNFLEDESPSKQRKIDPQMKKRQCPKIPISKRKTNAVSRRLHFEKSVLSRNSPSGPRSATLLPKANTFSLANLSRIERDPNHPWSSEEKILLCVLYRFYEDGNSKETIPATFNAVIGLGLPSKKIENYFARHLCLYGPRAIPEFRDVFKTGFDCPVSFVETHQRIQLAIETTGINLQRRVTEVIFKSGWACVAKSPATRRTYRQLVKSAKQKEKYEPLIERKTMEKVSSAKNEPIVLSEMSGNLSKRPIFQEFSAVNWRPQRSDSTPTLAFRVWDAESRAAYIPFEGFISEVSKRSLSITCRANVIRNFKDGKAQI